MGYRQRIAELEAEVEALKKKLSAYKAFQEQSKAVSKGKKIAYKAHVRHNEVYDLYSRGIKIAQIASKFNVSESTIKRRLRQHRADIATISKWTSR